LTINYIETSMRLYRRIRQRTRELLVKAQKAGYDRIRIEGEGDVADICRLTCLEQHIAVVNDPSLPVLEVQGTKVILHLEVDAWVS
jgi:hypothetical protein